MDTVNFDINDALKHYMSGPQSILTPEADIALLEYENDPESLSAGVAVPILNSIVDAVAESPDAITRSCHMDSLQFLLKCTSILPVHVLGKMIDLIISGLGAAAESAHQDLESPDGDGDSEIPHHKLLLQIYAFLLQWTIECVEAKAAEKATSAPVARGRGKPKGRGAAAARDGEGAWDSSTPLHGAMEVMLKVLGLKLSRIFLTTPERDTFIGLLTRPIYRVLESEQRVKSPIKWQCFKVLSNAVKHHGHGYAAQISIMQNLTYFEHLSEPMAELLEIIADRYDYPQLADEVLRELGKKEFNTNDTKGPKSVSAFILKLSGLAPRLVLKQITILAKQLDSESHTMRCAIIEVFGYLIIHLYQDHRSEDHKMQINAFFDVLEERVLDINPYCRYRALQVFCRLCELDGKFPKRRQRMAEIAVRSLEDKSSYVRRHAIKLLGYLIKTHPFSALHDEKLARKIWEERLDKTLEDLAAAHRFLEAPDTEERGNDTTVDAELLDDATRIESPRGTPRELTDEEKAAVIKKAQEEAAAKAKIKQTDLTKRYTVELLRFIDVLQDAMPTISQLLGSKNQSEVIEAMDYFEIADAYEVDRSKKGIRRMLRLIWSKGNSDEGKAVQSHLIECYKRMFFDAPDHFKENEAANYVTRNMISLTYGTTPAELTSLEQLLSTMMQKGLVPGFVIAKLWQVYGVRGGDVSRTQRRGAIIILGMLATASPEIAVGDMETMLRIGLGSRGRSDLQLAKYTCIALRRINPTGRQAKASSGTTFARLSNDHAVLDKLASITEVPSDSKEWFGVAEQAIDAIYALSKHPDTLCSDIIRRKTRQVFTPARPSRPLSRDVPSPFSTPAEDGDVAMTDAPPLSAGVGEESQQQQQQQQQVQNREYVFGLSQLLFVVGHVAIKQIVHLELCELDFKRRKLEREKQSKADSAANGQDAERDELDLIGGTTEDDFTEAMSHIRERELLYGPESLLALFGPLVSEICANNTAYPDQGLQAAATLCLAKLMCVSANYCEANLPLLITIMEKSTDPTVRSNVVIALGDMAVCFNHLIDENTDFLYRRLADTHVSVKRTCLMTLTFLILAGQVKVKGQLGEMAKCLEDEDKRIADLARMFFTELSTKDNAVYNHFVDMFGLLSADRRIDEDSFRRIVKFLLGFVEKDKHAKQLADKLAARLARCETERQWNDVAFALGLLQHKNEEITKLVSEGFKILQSAE